MIILMDTTSRLMIGVSLAGFADAAYLTYEKLSQRIVPCSINFQLIDCGKVLNSSYSSMLGIPVSALGMAFYAGMVLLLIVGLNTKLKRLRLAWSSLGLAMSVYFVAVQLFIIGAICVFCMFSAVTSTLLFILPLVALRNKIADPVPKPAGVS